jgi:hypothetical protein
MHALIHALIHSLIRISLTHNWLMHARRRGPARRGNSRSIALMQTV